MTHPNPEDVQKKLAEFMKKEFGDQVVLTGVMSQTDALGSEGDGDHAQEEKPLEFQFHYKPKDIKAHLDRFVIRQDEAKKVLSIAVCDHYHHVRTVELENKISSSEPREYSKQNVILLGPTGVGKTYLIRTIAQLIGVPFVKADATKFSETGYVGGDVDDLVRELVQKADGNVKKAQYGIVYIDEIDKIATPPNLVGRDVSGRGVQTNLLKLMEETEVALRSSHDLTAQMQAVMEFQRKGKIKRETINTRHILFIVSGAFDRLEEMILTRIKQNRIGFHARPSSEAVSPAELFREVRTEDFIKFGFEPEFIGRLPVRVVCDSLTEDDLFHVLQKSEGSIIHQYMQSFRAYGIEVLFRAEALREIARSAHSEKTGARALMTVCERVFRDFKFELPSSGVHRFEITAETIKNPRESLNRLLDVNLKQEREVLISAIQEFCQSFHQRHGLALKLENETLEGLMELVHKERCNVRDICSRTFKDFEFGLNLVRKNTGQTEFTISPKVLENPDQFLSTLVVGSYKTSTP